MARLSDRVTYAYCMYCAGLLIRDRQATFTDGWIAHAWCAVALTFAARRGMEDRRN